MAITVADNFSYQGKKPLDGRDTFTTLAAMKAYAEASVYDGCLSYCDEDGKRYEFKSTNTVDPTTGKWREYSSGGGGETYSDFTGATASTAGAHGLVPAPSAGDEGKVLFGNGSWGNIVMPSVDLSVLSNEAFIFDTSEKPVGMWTNRKLLWQKTVRFSTPKTLPANTWSTLDAMSNGEDIAKVMMHRDGGVGNVCTLATESVFDNGNLNVIVGTPANAIYAYTIQYTKTTDSPLASDVKFAGVTSTGEVILEKTVTGLNLFLVWDQQYVAAADMPYDTSSIGKLISLSGVGHSGENTPMSFALTGYVTGNNIKIICPAGAYVEEVTVRYTRPS